VGVLGVVALAGAGVVGADGLSVGVVVSAGVGEAPPAAVKAAAISPLLKSPSAIVSFVGAIAGRPAKTASTMKKAPVSPRVARSNEGLKSSCSMSLIAARARGIRLAGLDQRSNAYRKCFSNAS
jgi:hypothetical protein